MFVKDFIYTDLENSLGHIIEKSCSLSNTVVNLLVSINTNSFNTDNINLNNKNTVNGERVEQKENILKKKENVHKSANK